MKILFVTSRLPYPSTRGDQVRSYHFLRGLSRSHDVTVVTPVHDKPQPEELELAGKWCKRVEIVPVPKWDGLLRLAGAPFTGLPLQALYYCPPRVRDTVHSLIQRDSFDLVHVQYLRMAPVVESMNHIPKVIDLIDAQSLIMARRASRERGPMARVASLEARRVERYERTLTGKCDRLIVSSQLDRQAIGPYQNIHVVRNGVDTVRFPFVEEGRERHTIVFSGRMGYFPNADAAEYFATQIFPLVRKGIPDARLLIVGADPPSRVRQLGRLSGVTVTGFVPRVQEYLARAAVAVAPMRAGSGIQNKVLEAMASGVPVVATSTGLAGMEAESGVHLLVSDEPWGLAEGVIRLLEDGRLARAIARNAHALVEERYSWERCADELQGVYENLLTSPSASRAGQERFSPSVSWGSGAASRPRVAFGQSGFDSRDVFAAAGAAGGGGGED